MPRGFHRQICIRQHHEVVIKIVTLCLWGDSRLAVGLANELAAKHAQIGPGVVIEI